MRRIQIIGLMFVVMCAAGVAVASPASAVEFLRAEWLIAGGKVTTASADEEEAEMKLIDTNAEGVGVRAEVLCSFILDGTLGPGGADEVTELLNLSREPINLTALTELALVCTDVDNCTEALVWAEELPWKTEAELMEDGSETFFVDLTLNTKFYIECLILGVSANELCQAPTIVSDLTNVAGGTVDEEFSDAFQELAELKLGECGGRPETFILEGLLTVKPASGALTVSSEG
jgi:hypothetical protein